MISALMPFTSSYSGGSVHFARGVVGGRGGRAGGGAGSRANSSYANILPPPPPVSFHRDAPRTAIAKPNYGTSLVSFEDI